MVATVQGIGNGSPYPIKEVRYEMEQQSAPLPQPASSQKMSKEEVEAIVAELNKVMEMVGTTLSFYVDKDTKKTVVKVLDAQTHEVIRQIPPEEMLKVSQRISELLGILIDQSL